MVDLTRKIGVISASQGGFSSRGGLVGGQYQVVTPKVAPAPASYAGDGDIAVVYTNGSAILKNNLLVSLTVVSPETVPLSLSGGPFNEPYIIGSDTTIENVLYLTLDSLSPGAGPFTLEAWYRTRAAIAEDTPTICGISSGLADGFPFSTGYFDRSADTCNHSYGVSGGDAIEKRESSTELQWRHFAISRTGTSMRGYDHGNYIGTVWYGSEPGAMSFADSAEVQGGLRLDLGQLRYSKGIARYSGASINVPTAPFIDV